MGDRCYMEVWCRPQDVATFEELGFSVLDRDQDAGVHMHDEEANYGHSGALPTDIPYTASHEAGGDYGPIKIACDGITYDEVNRDHAGHLYVRVDEAGQINEEDLAEVRAFLAVQARATRLVADAFRSAVFDAARKAEADLV